MVSDDTLIFYNNMHDVEALSTLRKLENLCTKAFYCTTS